MGLGQTRTCPHSFYEVPHVVLKLSTSRIITFIMSMEKTGGFSHTELNNPQLCTYMIGREWAWMDTWVLEREAYHYYTIYILRT